MRTSIGNAAAVPENGVSGHFDMHERVEVNGHGAGQAAGAEMSQNVRPSTQAQVQYPFGYGDAVEVLRLVQESEAFASLELSIGDIRISIQRAQPTGVASGAAGQGTQTVAPVVAAHAVAPVASAAAPAAPTAVCAGAAPITSAPAAAVPAATVRAAPAPSAHAAASPAAYAAPAADAGLEKIVTPTLGVFYRRPSPDADPFVKEGDVIAEGDQIGVLEVMKLYMPINATVSGRIARIVAQDAALVEHGDVLMLVEPV